jgi:thiol-disulfide isomerase/thioredoxin
MQPSTVRLIAPACLVAVLRVGAAVAAPQAPADAPRPAAPALVEVAPPAMPDLRSPSEGWSGDDRSAVAVERGTEALRRAGDASRAAPGLRDSMVIRVTLPDGVRTEEAQVSCGPDGSFLIVAGNYRVANAGGKVAFLPDQPADQALVRAVQGSGHATMVSMLGSAPLPVPHLCFRQPLPGAADIDAFAECGVGRGARVGGWREAGDRTQVLLLAERAEAVVTIDRPSGMVRAVDSVFSPPGAAEGLRIRFEVTSTPVVGPLPAPIAVDLGSRRVSATMEEMFGAPDAPPPSACAVAVGAPAPLEALEDLDGRAFDLASLRGKAVVIDFWSTWCGPCRKGLPVLQRFADEMKDDPRVAVLAVDVWEQCEPGEVAAKVRDAAAKLSLRLPVLLDRDASLISAFGFQAIPATVVIAPDGTLAAAHLGLPQDLAAILRADVAKALGAPK